MALGPATKVFGDTFIGCADRKRRKREPSSSPRLDKKEHHPIPDASPVEVLRALMEANDLRQKELAPIFGSESIVSEILHKKRALNKAHIEKLRERFHVSPAVFF